MELDKGTLCPSLSANSGQAVNFIFWMMNSKDRKQ